MSIHRRALLTGGLSAGVVSALATSGWASAGFAAAPARGAAPGRSAAATELGLVPDALADQSRALQAAIDQGSARGVALRLPPGTYRISGVLLRNGTRLEGAGAATRIVSTGRSAPLLGRGISGVRLSALTIDGRDGDRRAVLDAAVDTALVVLERVRDAVIEDVAILASPLDGLALSRVSGRITGCRIAGAARAGLFSRDAEGLEIASTTIEDCGDNGILIWRSAAGEDATLVRGNRIRRIAATSGGNGQNGNGINVFRGAGVLVTGNRIADCAYSAIRANAADDVQMVANSVARIGEVALYAEFGFTGAVISANLVDRAATGIAVTNFDHGGRLAVVQGNLVRNLSRREHESVDKRGEGITVEADAAVTGNTIENAATSGLVIGWGPFMRNVAATGNMIRNARIGIAITADPRAGRCLVAQNLVAGSRDGAIRRMDHGRPVGPDLAVTPPADGPLSVADNVVG